MPELDEGNQELVAQTLFTIGFETAIRSCKDHDISYSAMLVGMLRAVEHIVHLLTEVEDQKN